MTWQLLEGDCIAVMNTMEPSSVDAVVCDPPYGLSREPDIAEVLTHWLSGDDYKHRGGGFMGRSWDSFVPGPAYWRAAYRVLKPGGHLLSFGGTRTYDLLVIALRLAGFEIRDTIAWLYASGFPKALSVSKALEAEARPLVAAWFHGPYGSLAADATLDMQFAALVERAEVQIAHDGEGTALKPAHEPIVVARKPLTGNVAGNVLTHGTGALNIAATRIAGERGDGNWTGLQTAGGYNGIRQNNVRGEDASPAGRWPANVVLDEEAAALLDEQTGELTSGDLRPYTERHENASSYRFARERTFARDGDSGGASRFFYVAKASSAERNAGLEGSAISGETKALGRGLRNTIARCPTHDASLPSGVNVYRCGCGQTYSNGEEDRRAAQRPRYNTHSTVKPITLMRWLIRLVTPPGGLVLDPFAGSGTTGCAAALEGFNFVGIESEPAYVPLARGRIEFWSRQPVGAEVDAVLEAHAIRTGVAATGQDTLFS